MKKAIWFALSLAVVALAGCGKSNNDGGGNAGAPNPYYPGSCQAGYVYTQYGCLPQNNCPAGMGYLNGTCIPGSVGGQYGGIRYAATLSVTDRGQFQRLMEYSGRCVNSSSWYYGTNRCEMYSSTGYVIVYLQNATMADGSQVQTEIVGGASSPTSSPYSNGNYGWYITPIKMNFPMTYRAINNNQGFELTDGSQFNYPTGRIRVKADVGSFANASVPVVLEYEGREFARTTIQRW